jgi:class 3 adenylate cyclase
MMGEACEPNQIVLSGVCCSGVEGVAPVRPLGRVALRGRAEPVDLFELDPLE